MATKLQPYAIGKVAKDSEEDSWDIEVFPIEILPTYSGDLNQEDKSTRSGESPFGENDTATIIKDQRIPCEWLPLYDPYLISPPQVFVGQTVMIWYYESLNKFFWTKVYTESQLRKKEKRIIWLSNQSEAGDIEPEQGYYLVMDTINKFIKLHTSDNDGESTTYDITLNTQEGKLSIVDGLGNAIEFDSPSKTLSINTGDKVEINTKEAIVNAEQSVTVKTSTCTIESDMCKIN